ncbi:hypothetical protein DOTSEDRAFT_75639 [Dothistroma septosporum NZE10]|uniref:Uncharacterized protein n=1 Tax=Dothistroma septosporum (strain NZE10 / CBS 128990) TaxID=675120 RepID=M2Y127_DOTSN|nr:hypothetical protein DOTSEDRAFT_75639 [Dothistroma septosporum NZE10]
MDATSSYRTEAWDNTYNDGGSEGANGVRGVILATCSDREGDSVEEKNGGRSLQSGLP